MDDRSAHVRGKICQLLGGSLKIKERLHEYGNIVLIPHVQVYDAR